MNTPRISRRYFLRGLGTAVALPSLEAMTPVAKAMAAQATPPMRMAFFFVPNGVNMEHWRPKQSGANFDLPYCLQPLEPVKQDLLVLSGLTHDKGRANADAAGDHARSAGVFLTGAQPLKSEGAVIRAGVSVDQYAARALGKHTRFPSLEIGTETGRPYGKCDSGYACGYSNNISWKDESTPMTKLVNPREVFDRMFGDDMGMSEAAKERRARRRLSILDLVMDDAKRLEQKVGQSDRHKLDQYFTSIREIELRIENARHAPKQDQDALADLEVPEGVPDLAGEHLRLLGDLLVLAFQTDQTRVCSFMFANDGSNRTYPEINVTGGHHELSHHQGNEQKLKHIAEINCFHVAQFSYILQRLKAIPEGEGTLLDHSMIVYGSGIGDGNRHNHDDLPILLAGNAGGAIRTGRHLVYPGETPVCNLFNSMLDCAGIPVDFFGDSTGRLRHLAA